MALKLALPELQPLMLPILKELGIELKLTLVLLPPPLLKEELEPNELGIELKALAPKLLPKVPAPKTPLKVLLVE